MQVETGPEELSHFAELHLLLELDSCHSDPLSTVPQDRASTIAGIHEFAVQDTITADFSMTAACVEAADGGAVAPEHGMTAAVSGLACRVQGHLGHVPTAPHDPAATAAHPDSKARSAKGLRTNVEVMAMMKDVPNGNTVSDELRKAVNTRMTETLKVMKRIDVEKKLGRPIDRHDTVEDVKILEAKLRALLQGNGNAHLMWTNCHTTRAKVRSEAEFSR